MNHAQKNPNDYPKKKDLVFETVSNRYIPGRGAVFAKPRDIDRSRLLVANAFDPLPSSQRAEAVKRPIRKLSKLDILWTLSA
jgi:hypothetical protein